MGGEKDRYFVIGRGGGGAFCDAKENDTPLSSGKGGEKMGTRRGEAADLGFPLEKSPLFHRNHDCTRNGQN